MPHHNKKLKVTCPNCARIDFVKASALGRLRCRFCAYKYEPWDHTITAALRRMARGQPTNRKDIPQ